ncbi:MAG: SDR family oxidoreductase, partial [Hyphomicrobiaceae bacterium]|nr:SDR family oxidoreductase [Hyphomicrobiaceae bacterium]
RALAARGVKVAVLDLSKEAGERVAREIGGVFCHCDVTKDESVDAALAAARAAHGQERITVNCAGIAIGKRVARRNRDTGKTEAHDAAGFAKVLEVNLIGTFRVMARSAAGMLTVTAQEPDGERGVIVNTSSVAAEDGQIGQCAYAASKGGVAALSLPAARDLAREGIRVMAIMPGLFDTSMFAGLPSDVRNALASNVPFPSRLGRPEEYAALVCAICENTMLNGGNIRLDGAIRLAPN